MPRIRRLRDEPDRSGERQVRPSRASLPASSRARDPAWQEGVVTQVLAVRWTVRVGDTQLLCVVKRSRGGEGLPVVGDRVLVDVLPGDTSRIMEILPRRSALRRPEVHHGRVAQVLAANLDQVLIVASVAEPPLKPGLVDRYLVATWREGLRPLLCLSKVDLPWDEDTQEAIEGFEDLELPVVRSSITTGAGLDRLLEELRGRVTVLVGLSGVGKTSLARLLLRDDRLRIAEVSDATGKGRHTTTSARWLDLPDGVPGAIIDMPGQRVFSLEDLTEADLMRGFPELRDLPSCRFPGCSHLEEEGCEVLHAFENGQISARRLDAYLRIRSELIDLMAVG